MKRKRIYLGELAWEMIRSGNLRIHYKSIPERIKSYFGDRIKDQHELDVWESDLRSQTLLHNNAGYFEFAHKSLAETFGATALINQSMNAVCEFLREMVTKVSTRRLRHII